MALPNISVAVAFDSGFSTPEGDRTWTDVSAYVEGEQEIAIGYGRTDELSVPDANSCSVTLDNRDGRFTPGKASSPYFPDVKKGRPLRVSVRYADEGSGNLLTANQASMETSVADWSAGGSVPPTLSWSTTHPSVGSRGLLITWGTGGSLPLAATTVTGLVVGRTYTAQAQVWVPTSSPNVRLVVGSNFGTVVSTKNAHAQASVTFVATAASHALQVWPSTAPTSGHQCWVDSVMVDEGSSVGTFTTDPPPIHTRFTGYINEWPVVWPDGTDAASTVTITAASRKARLGNTAPLTSAIRAAYLESEPDAYWPLGDELQNSAGQYVFLDVTNTMVNNQPTQALAGFNTLSQPIVLNDTAGPTDEGGLVKLPAYSDSLLLGSFAAYVGAGTAVNINSAGEFTVEVVARTVPTRMGVNVYATQIFIASTSHEQGIIVYVFGPWEDSATGAVTVEAVHRNPDTWAINDNPKFPATGSYTPTEFADSIDGEMHHYALTVTGGNTMSVYFDGVLLGSDTLAAPFMFDKRFTNIAFGVDTLRANLWLGHAAAYDRALTSAEILSHARAATAATETTEERVVRVAGRVGVPSAEIDVETTIAANVGPQPEAGRSAAEVLDEAATSTGGVLHDGRDGHLVMRARNSRYNVAPAFSLSAGGQEIQADLTVTDDHRYTANTVEFTRAGNEEVPATVIDQDSIDAYGVFSQSYTVVSSSGSEVESFARDRLHRFADPDPRVSQVSVDLVNIPTAQRAEVLSADIGTRFEIVGLAAQAPATEMGLFLEGYEETITAKGHFLTMNTTPGDIYQNVLILDDAVRGELDADNVLAY